MKYENTNLPALARRHPLTLAPLLGALVSCARQFDPHPALTACTVTFYDDRIERGAVKLQGTPPTFAVHAKYEHPLRKALATERLNAVLEGVTFSADTLDYGEALAQLSDRMKDLIRTRAPEEKRDEAYTVYAELEGLSDE